MNSIFGPRVEDYSSSNMVIERIQLRKVADLRIDKVHCCYFDDGNNLQVVDVLSLRGKSNVDLQLLDSDNLS